MFRFSGIEIFLYLNRCLTELRRIERIRGGALGGHTKERAPRSPVKIRIGVSERPALIETGNTVGKVAVSALPRKSCFAIEKEKRGPKKLFWLTVNMTPQSDRRKAWQGNGPHRNISAARYHFNTAADLQRIAL